MAYFVAGEGPAYAQIMFVGEAPGAKEEKAGRPFVGLAGKFLKAEIEKIGLDFEKVYKTNVVKVRCKGKPSHAQIKKHLPFLEEEIKLIKPKIVVLLGETAHKHTPRVKGVKYIKAPHPAAARRFPKQKDLFRASLKTLKKLL